MWNQHCTSQKNIFRKWPFHLEKHFKILQESTQHKRFDTGHFMKLSLSLILDNDENLFIHSMGKLSELEATALQETDQEPFVNLAYYGQQYFTLRLDPSIRQHHKFISLYRDKERKRASKLSSMYTQCYDSTCSAYLKSA